MVLVLDGTCDILQLFTCVGLCSSMFWCALVCACISFDVLVCACMCLYGPVYYACKYFCGLVCTCTFFYPTCMRLNVQYLMLACTRMQLYSPACACNCRCLYAL